MTSTTNGSSENKNNIIQQPSFPSSWTSSPISLPRELSVYGFINQLIHKVSHSHPHSIITRIAFPSPIYSLIHLYYGLVGSYEVIAIGKHNSYEIRFREYSPEILAKATPLPALSSLTSNPNDIFIGHNRLLVKDKQNRLHYAGRNEYGDCGVNSNEHKIKSFTRIHSNPYNPNAIVDDIQFVTSSLTASHTIVMTSTGDLYSFGANQHGQRCLATK